MSFISEDIRLCDYYLNVQTFAEKLVNSIAEEAEEKVNGSSRFKSYSSQCQMKMYCFNVSSSVFDLSDWPTVEEFDIEQGAKSINRYLSSFSLMEEWMYAIYFINKQENRCCTFYNYHVVWSLPTPLFPVVQAAASMFFTFEISILAPQNCPIKVTFQMETNGFKHEANKSVQLSDIWMNWILDAKMTHFPRFKF